MTDPQSFPSTTTHHALPLLFAGQSQKETTVNEALTVVDILLNPVIEATVSTPPATPAIGKAWIVGPSPSGAFAGRAGQIAAWTNGGWRFLSPARGMSAHDTEHDCTIRFTDAWNHVIAPAPPSGGTVVDTQARAVIATVVTLLTQAGIFSSP